MNYIPFPRLDLDKHSDLVNWCGISPKKEGSWKSLKPYLANSARILPNEEGIPKCWFSELPQGDDIALDVEHFRPKNSGSPLSPAQIATVKKLSRLSKIPQLNQDHTYEWLEHDYRNYRLVTAKTNRSGAKHIYFPVIQDSKRLKNGKYPWKNKEFPLLLDPADAHDAAQLFVKPTGEIAPIAPFAEITDQDLLDIETKWHTDPFNYLRSWVTIFLFRLNDPVFIAGRKEVFNTTLEDLQSLDMLINENKDSQVIPRLVQNLFKRIVPSSPFSLAAISAMHAYIPLNPNNANPITTAIQNLFQRLKDEVGKLTLNWDKP